MDTERYEAAYERDAEAGSQLTSCLCCGREISVATHERNDGYCDGCGGAWCGDSCGLGDTCRLDDASDVGLGVEPRGGH